MVAISFLIGTMVVGLVIYTATVERQKEYGVLKAIGASNGTLYRVVVFQALIAALVGSAAGVVMAFGFAKLIMIIRPQFLIALNLRDVAWTLVTGIVMALAAGFFPARVVARLAPATVFRK
jgi:putative ABC transport system permease protein